ncbi:MAG: ATP-binding protein [Desulfovermiculus sp.]
MSFPFRYSLFQALLIYIILPLSFTLGLAGYLSLLSLENQAEKKMQEEVQLIARALELPLSHSLERGRAGSILQALESAFQINRIYAVAVYNQHGEKVASAGASVIDQKANQDNDQLADMAEEGDQQEKYERVGGQEAYSYFLPLTDSGGRINGLLQLSRKKEDFQKYVNDLRLQFGLILCGGIGIMILLVLFGHRRALGYHLERLGRSMHRVEQGDRTHRLFMHGPKEITNLAAAFNTMLDSMDQAQEALEEQRQKQARLESELRKAEKMAAVGRLAAGVAHELGTPLSIVAGQAQRARRIPELPDKVSRNLDQIRDQVKRMESIVRQLLDFSRGNSACRREVDPASIVNKAIQSMIPLADQKRVNLEKSGPQTGCVIMADPLRVEQMLANLLKNAVQAAPADTGRVRLEWECTSAHCIFRIQDNGPGIPPDMITKICDPFFTTKPVGEGTGLGLAVVHGIVEEHQGSLHIEISPLGGAEFRIVLPRNSLQGGTHSEQTLRPC